MLGKGKTPQQMYSPETAIDKTVAQNILFLHAFSGCDTTSALYGHDKLKLIKTLQQHASLKTTVRVFKDENAEPDVIAEAGLRFFEELYG
ncbi:hypothetical protein ILUMI_04694 [Ignelater luminosus]|uniref:Uncharacterized protein n=1 Tax=Ignelater luminosus TaxID=2038154 RepID=A0A8K0DDZ3_IGNLU|nr:hypothetical protein ILUMI_04694 [Ignelater luminosus]